MHGIPLLRDLVILIAVALPVVLLAHRLRIPSVVGFLISGIAIGPTALGLVRETQEVATLAEIGMFERAANLRDDRQQRARAAQQRILADRRQRLERGAGPQVGRGLSGSGVGNGRRRGRGAAGSGTWPRAHDSALGLGRGLVLGVVVHGQSALDADRPELELDGRELARQMQREAAGLG